MATEQAEYYGIKDNELHRLGLQAEDIEFIYYNFQSKHKYESWASIHEDEAINAEQGARLAANMQAKQQELLEDLLRGLFGKLPSPAARARYTSMRTGEQASSVIRWLYWRNRPIVCMTLPISYVQHSRYFLRWYWQTTEYALSKIRGDNG